MRPHHSAVRSARPARPRLVFALVALVALCPGAGGVRPARAQSAPSIPAWAVAHGEWSPAFASPAFDDRVAALIAHRTHLIAAGDFHRHGGVATRHIAAWDGAAWSALGSGLDSAAVALALWQGSLVVAGRFEHAGGIPCLHVARWDGTAWSAMDAGLEGRVTGLAAGDFDLVAAGELTIPGDTTRLALARWSGERWEAMAPAVEGEVTEVVEHRGRFVIAVDHLGPGFVDSVSIHRWENPGWGSLSRFRWGGAPQQRLAVQDDELHLLGIFSRASPYYSGTAPVLVLGDTGWVDVSGLRGHASKGVRTPWGLVVTGTFDSGLQPYPMAIVHPHSSVIVGQVPHPRPDALAWWAGGLATIGRPPDEYDRYRGSPTMLAPAAFDRSSWVELRPLGPARAGILAAAGSELSGFDTGRDTLTVWGAEDLYRPADPGWAGPTTFLRWDAGVWRPGAGVSVLQVMCAVRRPEGMVVGHRGQPGPRSATTFIRRLVANEVEPLGTGLDSIPRRLVESPFGLAVLGDFRMAGGLRVPGIALWDGAAWQAIAGLDSASRVTACTAVGGALWLGGDLGPHGALARWDGAALTAVATSTTRRIDGLVASGDQLVAAGEFEIGGRLFGGLALWDGSAWRALDDGHIALSEVRGLASEGPDLYALAEVAVDGDALGTDVARWDGLGWTLLGARVDGPVEPRIHAIAAHEGALWMAGRFSSVAGVSSYAVARWTPGGAVRPDGRPSTATFDVLAPNPSSTVVQLAFTLSRVAGVRITLHDVAGRQVRVLFERALASGSHRLAWDGRDDAGRLAPAGVYLARLQVDGERTRARRIVRLP